MDLTFCQRLIRTKDVTHHTDDIHEHHSFELRRSIGLFSLTMIGVGATIGTGIFFTMAVAVPKAGPAVILSFLLAALTAGLTALCYAELSFKIPSSGSAYSFAYASLGEFVAYSVAACLLLEYGLAASAVAIGWSDYLNNFLSNLFHWQIPDMLRTPMIILGEQGVEFHFNQVNLPPILLVLMCSILLFRGTQESASTNAIMVIIKLLILVFFIAIALLGFNIDNFSPFFNTDNSKGLAGMAGVAAASGTVFFSFIGLDTIATAGSEAKNPKRNIPLSIMAALGIVTLFYLLVAIAAMGAQPAEKFMGQEAGLAVILRNVTGHTWPALILSAGAILSIFSITLVTIYGQTRVLYAMSKDGLAPSIFKKVNPKTNVPVNNTIAVSIVVGIIAGTVDANFLWDMVSMGTLTAFIVVAIAIPVVRHRNKKFQKGAFHVPFGPYFIPILSIAACIYIMKDLPTLTFHVFGIWMLGFTVLYFIHGMKYTQK